MADPQGVSIAFDNDLLDASPTWTRVDEDYVTGYEIHRGKQTENDGFQTGLFTITIVDTTGAFDRNNDAGLYSDTSLIRKQVAIALQNPTDDSWSSLVRGMIIKANYSLDATGKLGTLTLECCDMMGYFAQCELVADATKNGDDVVDGNIVYNANPSLAAVQTRIVQVADEFGWPGSGANDDYRDINSGNVALQQDILAPRETAFDVMSHAAWSEFPGMGGSNLYMSKDGKLTLQGRFARFRPDVVDYHIDRWPMGDQDACDTIGADVCPIVGPLDYYEDEADVYTVGVCWPNGIVDSDIEVQHYSDDVAIDKYGRRVWSQESLLTDGGVGGTTGLEECAKFSQYVVDNKSTPQTRCGQIVLETQEPDSANGAAFWNTVCGIELSDIVEVSTLAAWGAGFDQREFYVEGIHIVAEPFRAEHPRITVTLDTSPAGYFDSSPFTEP